MIALVALSFMSMLWVTFAPHALFGLGLPERLAVDPFFLACAAIGASLFFSSFKKEGKEAVTVGVSAGER